MDIKNLADKLAKYEVENKSIVFLSDLADEPCAPGKDNRTLADCKKKI